MKKHIRLFLSASRFRSAGLAFAVSIVSVFFVSTKILPLYAQEQSELAARTAVNPFNQGGVIPQWLFLGPFSLDDEKPVPMTDSSSQTDQQVEASEHDFLTFLGGEQSAFIEFYSATTVVGNDGEQRIIHTHPLQADSVGIITLDTLFSPEKHGEYGYIFCLVESFIPCKVRGFWAADGGGYVWVNGNRVTEQWNKNDSCVPLLNSFDAEFVQGMNSILIKIGDFTPQKRFTFELYEIQDSIVPYISRINSCSLAIDNQYLNSSDDLSLNVLFNIHVPESIFSATVTVTKEKGIFFSSDTVESVSAYSATPQCIELPVDLQGALKIAAECSLPNGMQVRTQRYIWKGTYQTFYQSQQRRIAQLFHDTAMVRRNKQISHFETVALHGALKWADRWFTSNDFLSDDEKIRQLQTVSSTADLIDTLLNHGVFPRACIFPVIIATQSPVEPSLKSVYDPSRWLVYKYPDLYHEPTLSDTGGEYTWWISVPEKMKRKRKKFPLIVALHSLERSSRDISSSRDFGTLAFAEDNPEFDAIVAVAHCADSTLWNASVIKQTIGILTNTGRIDTKKVYGIGDGMGAFTILHLAAVFPTMFTAIVPINGGGNPESACALKNIPLWAFHGARNKRVPVEFSQNMITAIKQCRGDDTEFSIYPEGAQDIGAAVLNDKKLYTWLLRQRK